MKPDAAMVMTTRMAESLGVGPNTSTTNTLTPTTLRSITQLFESEDCLSNLRRIEDPSEVAAATAGFAPPVVVSDKISFVNLDSKSGWNGGTTTVLTPSKVIPHIGVLMAEGQEEEIEGEIKEDDTTPIMVAPEIVDQESTRPRRSTRNNFSTRDMSPDYEPTPKKKKRNSAATPAKKRSGGRKPAARRGSEEDSGDYSPEEWARLQVRRQRNKEAAARCRKRRVDLTNQLLEEVEGHDVNKRALEDEIRQLKAQKEELEFILEAHSQHCRIQGSVVRQQQQRRRPVVNAAPLVVAVKSEPAPANLVVTENGGMAVVVEAADAPYVIPETVTLTSAVTGMTSTAIVSAPAMPKPRPASLSITAAAVPVSESGVVIETPSTVVPALAFDTVTTGLTPMGIAPTIASIVTPTLNTPTCSAQQRNAEIGGANNTGSPIEYVTL